MRRTMTLATGLGLSALLLAGCGDDQPLPVAEAMQPDLSMSAQVDGPIRIGVLVPPVEGIGSEFRPLVEGARVAAYRFELGGAEVEFTVALDDGTEAGAQAAMKALLDDDVAGVVLASTGDHTASAVRAARQASTAVVLPYGGAEGEGVWSLAPSDEAVVTQIEAALAEADAERPYLATADGREQLDLHATHAGVLGASEAMAQEIVALLESREVDSVVIDGSAQEQADLVVALQGLLGSRQLPVVLTPEALTTDFGDRLTAAGTTAGWLFSVGTDTDDHVALTESEAGQNAAVFFSALRLASGDVNCVNIYGDDSCAAGITRGDVASHDATVALIRAVEAAASTDPAAVRTALSGLDLAHADGVVGPDLDFGQGQTLADEDVAVLHASTSDPGLRPADASGDPAATLFWFAGGAQ
ncbi:ABC transporter substrate-binding protein [Cellulomonas sp. NPDC089187]|uniref:ABC transporter substrate-binding protein n=1 Tax=Cellulomonas sp. NPDC089187 TaxID=3154970 RepID=UPI00344368EF